MKNKYVSPEMYLLTVSEEDVLSLSGFGSTYIDGDNGGITPETWLGGAN